LFTFDNDDDDICLSFKALFDALETGSFTHSDLCGNEKSLSDEFNNSIISFSFEKDMKYKRYLFNDYFHLK
jgi:hypothetical protein